jgi:peptidoglycan/LPS O-acetylase OafA/YrhL
MVTVTSIVWVAIIHWLACSESGGDLNVVTRILKLDVFRCLARFSLQIYLTHAVTSVWLEYALRGIGILDWFSKDFQVVYVYCVSYAFHVHVQPRLDALVVGKTTNQQEKELPTV